MIGRLDATNRPTGVEPSLANLCYPLVANEPFVAIGLLTETNIRMLGPSLRQVFPIPHDHKFDDLIRALDEVCERTAR
jgi:hypothetical protein